MSTGPRSYFRPALRFDKICSMPHEDTCKAWLNVWKRRGIRAPHKPLLLLVALRGALDDSDRLMPFRWWDEKLRPLLRRYTTSKSLHTEYPFWRLQRDGLWEVLGGEGLIKRRSNDDPLKSALIANNVRGGFTESM